MHYLSNNARDKRTHTAESDVSTNAKEGEKTYNNTHPPPRHTHTHIYIISIQTRTAYDASTPVSPLCRLRTAPASGCSGCRRNEQTIYMKSRDMALWLGLLCTRFGWRCVAQQSTLYATSEAATAFLRAAGFGVAVGRSTFEGARMLLSRFSVAGFTSTETDGVSARLNTYRFKSLMSLFGVCKEIRTRTSMSSLGVGLAVGC